MRRAEMRHPSRQEQCGIMHVARIHRAGAKKITRMIEHHQNHDQATQQIDAVEPGSRGRTRHASCVNNRLTHEPADPMR